MVGDAKINVEEFIERHVYHRKKVDSSETIITHRLDVISGRVQSW